MGADSDFLYERLRGFVPLIGSAIIRVVLVCLKHHLDNPRLLGLRGLRSHYYRLIPFLFSLRETGYEETVVFVRERANDCVWKTTEKMVGGFLKFSFYNPGIEGGRETVFILILPHLLVSASHSLVKARS